MTIYININVSIYSNKEEKLFSILSNLQTNVFKSLSSKHQLLYGILKEDPRSETFWGA